MPSISGKVSNSSILIEVTLQPTQIALGSVEAAGCTLQVQMHALRGLVDTGAQRSMISAEAARRAGLVPRGKIRIGNVHTIEHHNAYSVVLGVVVDDGNGDAMNATRGIFTFEPVLAAELRDSGSFDVLIGMDIISQGDLLVRRDGSFCFALGRDKL